MKLKNRGTVFVVVRGREAGAAVVGVFMDYDEAENYAGACEQQWLEKTGASVPFEVQLSTYYG
jgi:ADP-ribose pyrophosphatase YjhB (NUDIX family)